MDIRIKESMYLSCQGQEYVVRTGTVGVERNKVVFFYDVTRTVAAGFSREFCLQNPQTFSVSRTLNDKEVSIHDVLKVIQESSLSPIEKSSLELQIRTL